ncbi:MAG: phosphatase PAP2 family protein [Oscillospiraceae bacterium]
MLLTKKHKKIIGFSLLAIFLIALAVFFGIYDLQISNAIANAESGFGLAMELSGMLVAPYLFIAAGLVIAVYYQKSLETAFKKTKIALGLIFAFGGICFCGYIYVQLPSILNFFAFLITGLVCGVFIALLRKKTPEQIYELLKISLVTIVYLLAVLIVINIVKMLWGRVRFREMTDPSQFTPWFIPQGINGNRSFPSGHTSNAATLYVLTMFAPLVKKNWQKALCYIVPILWIVVMAASRVMVGAHYCSDVLFGAIISVSLFYISKKFTLKKLEQ